MFAHLTRCFVPGLLLIVALPLMSVGAIDLGPDQPCAAISFGRLGGGTLEVTQVGDVKREYEVNQDLSLGVTFDFPLGHGLFAGAGADWQSVTAGSEFRDGLIDLGGIELAAHLKGLISFHDGRFAIRPGIGLGGLEGDFTSLTLRATLELQASLTERLGVGFQAGLWSVPIGTNDRVDVHIGSSTLLRAQILISMGSKENDSGQ